MKKHFLACVLIAASIGAQAQIDISDARTMAIGTSVTVTGIVMNGDEMGGVRYVQDNTAGIAVFPGAGSVAFDAERTDSITLTGTLKDYNGLLEIDPITAFTNHGSGFLESAASIVTPAQVSEGTEASLLQIQDAQFTDGGATFTSSTWEFTANGESSVVFLRAGHPLIGTVIPSGPVHISGICSQFTFSTPPTDGYQLLPRDSDDIILTSPINVTSLMTQTNIATAGFDLSWTTDNAGSTNINYGTTTALGTMITDVNSTTDHMVNFTGLTPATIYYAQGFVILGLDTAFTTVQAFSTASNSSGEMKVYFNRSVDTSVSSGVDAIELDGTVNDTIKAYLDRATTTVDIAMYNASNAMIMGAINDAYNRGVQIRYITEGENANTGLDDLDAGIPILARQNSMSSGMHNKFVIIDADMVDESIVIGGSTNWTFNNLFDDFNNMVIIQDQSLARAYRAEFEEMWGGSDATPGFGNTKFGPDKANNTPHEFIVGGSRVELYFSPSDGTTNAIKNAIETTNSRMDFALLAFTNNDLRDATLAAHNSFGVGVNGIIEQTTGSGTDFQDLFDGGVNVKSHQGVPDQLHHKYAIIDEGTTSDPLVLTGSHNWSASAETENDENTLFIHNDVIANQFFQEFTSRIDELTGIEESLIDPFSMKVYPNPSTDRVFLNFSNPSSNPAELALYDLSGRIIWTEELRSFNGQNRVELDATDLAIGMYQLVVTIGAVRDQELFVIGR